MFTLIHPLLAMAPQLFCEICKKSKFPTEAGFWRHYYSCIAKNNFKKGKKSNADQTNAVGRSLLSLYINRVSNIPVLLRKSRKPLSRRKFYLLHYMICLSSSPKGARDVEMSPSSTWITILTNLYQYQYVIALIRATKSSKEKEPRPEPEFLKCS